MSNLQNSLRESLAQAGLAPESRLVIGVSGGPDSLALLHVTGKLISPEFLWVAHLNHGLRPDADAEEAFVAQVAAAGGYHIRYKKVDVAALAREEGWTVEEAGRNARYDFLTEAAAEAGAEAVLVAHNMDDQAETVLHHLLRGSGLRGLQGMRAARSLPGNPEIRLLRPFLGISRAAIETYCAEHDLQPMIDQTNRDPAYLRNRLRHELLPLLAEYNPQIREHLRQLAEIVAADEDYLEQVSEQAWKRILEEKGANWLRLDRRAWRTLPLSLRRRLLRKSLVALQPALTDISFRTIDQAEQVAREKETGAGVTLPGGIVLRLEYEHLLLAVEGDYFPLDQPQLPDGVAQILPIPGSLVLDGGWRLSAAVVGGDLVEVRDNRDPWTAYLDVGQTQTLLVRGRKPGEVMQPLGMDGRSASLQDIMVNRKLPESLRERWPLVATEQHPVWLVGQHVDERAKITNNTRRSVKVSCVKQKE